MGLAELKSLIGDLSTFRRITFPGNGPKLSIEAQTWLIKNKIFWVCDMTWAPGAPEVMRWA